MAQTASAPVTGPAVKRNGLRFETLLASPNIVIPNKNVGYGKKTTALCSVRVTNLTLTAIRFDPFRLYPTKVIKPNGKKLFADPIHIAGLSRPAQEADYIFIQPNQSVVLPGVSSFYWQRKRLCLSLGFRAFDDHPLVYEGLTAGAYHICFRYNNLHSTVEIRREFMEKPIKTLTGLWTGDVVLPPLTFQLVTR